MSVVGSVAVRVVPSMSGFGPTIAKEGGPAAAKQGRILGSTLGKALAGGLAVAGVAVAGFGVYALKEFAKFEKGMNEVFTLLPGISEEAMGKMNEDTRKFVREMGIAHDEAVPALYSAISAGIPQENVFDFMEVAARASIGGVTDMETAVDGLTSVMNAYGQENMSATEASDLMFTAVKLGKTDFEELSGSLFNVLPTASALGVEFGDVTAAMASMTAQGTPTSVATTQLRQMMVELSKDGGDMANTFQEISGKTFKEFIAEGGNTQEALELLSEHAKESGLGINDLFGSVEAGSAALSLSGDNADAYASNIEAMGDSAGATATAYEGMDEGISRSMERIGIQMKDAAIQIGDNLAPAAQMLADFLQDNLPGAIETATEAFETIWESLGNALQGLRDMGDWISRNRGTILGLGSALTGAAVGMVAFRTALAVNQLFTTFSGGLTLARLAMIPFDLATRSAAFGQRLLNAAMRANPIGLIVTAIGALVGGLTWFFTQTEAGGKIWDKVWGGIKRVTGDVVDWFMDHVVGNFKEFFGIIFRGDFDGQGSFAEDSPVIDFFFRMRDVALSVSDWFTGTFVPALKSAWDSIANAGKWAWENVLEPVFSAIGAAATWLWESALKPSFDFIVAAWENLVSVFDWWWNGVLKQVFIFLGDLIVWLWNGVVKPYFGSIQDRWQGMVSAFQLWWATKLKPMFDAVGAIISWLWNDIARPLFARIQERWERMANALVTFYNTVIKPMLDTFGDWVKRLYNNYVKPALDWISDRWDWLSGKLSDFWENKIKPVLEAFGDFVQDTLVGRVEKGVEMIKDAWETVKEGFATPINWVINKVWNDGIAGAFDSVSKAIGSDARMAKIPEIGAYAKGGKVREDWYLAGEEGPELIHRGAQSHRVYTAGETRAALQGDVDPAASDRLAGSSPSQAMLPMGGGWISKAWDSVKDAASGALNWVRGGLASAAESLLKPIISAATSRMSQFGGMGELGGGLIDNGVDRVLEWIRGEDSVAEGGGFEYDGPMNMGNVYRPGAGPITSWYGQRWGRLHGGVDFAGRRGAPTFAAWDGIVHSIMNYPGSGLSVNLSHGGGKYSHYGHNDPGGIPVSPGQRVKAGQRVGNMGMTGNTTGPHLHFETWQGGLWNRRNPNHLFRDKGGLLPPGVSSVLNNTGGNEFIFNQKQFENLNRLAEQGGSGRTVQIVQHGIEFEHADRNAQAIRFAERRASRGVGVR